MVPTPRFSYGQMKPEQLEIERLRKEVAKLKAERDILKGLRLLCERRDMKFAFIAKHRSIWPVAWLCEALGVSRSGFHAWLNRSPSRHARQDEVLLDKIKDSFKTVTAPTVPGGFGMIFLPKAFPVVCIVSSVSCTKMH